MSQSSIQKKTTRPTPYRVPKAGDYSNPPKIRILPFISNRELPSTIVTGSRETGAYMPGSARKSKVARGRD